MTAKTSENPLKTVKNPSMYKILHKNHKFQQKRFT